VAVTGGIAEGKSTVLAELASMGHSTASADLLAREIFSDPQTNARLAAIAGTGGQILPAELRASMLASREIRRQVNRVMHPLVAQAIDRSGAQFVEVPLLIETCLQGDFDRVWVVTCGAEEQRRRLLERYRDESTVIAILAAQMPARAKIPFSDSIIRTNRPLQHVRRLLSEALAVLQA
jgi:dephospho-CoA kinase